MSIYLNNPWKPAKYSIIKDDQIAAAVQNKGYSVQPILSKEAQESLIALFNGTHQIENVDGGMFYSIYSQDTDYRKKIHEEIKEIIQPMVNQICDQYKMVLNSFVVKISGKKSEFYLHQDTTGIDEWEHSPLSLWIPLQDVDENNGCLGIIPCSQHFLTPYRSISFPAPFDHIQNTVKQYLQPLKMKSGEVLIFDNRMLHHSYSNKSGQPRIALICGLFPKEAQMITCHKPVYECGGQVEIIGQEDDFLLTGKNFLIDCQKRPESGTSLKWVEDPYPPISEDEFDALCRKYGIEKNSPNRFFENTECNMVAEPSVNSQQKKNLVKKVFSLFKEKN
jgi:hypothetical protein